MIVFILTIRTASILSVVYAQYIYSPKGIGVFYKLHANIHFHAKIIAIHKDKQTVGTLPRSLPNTCIHTWPPHLVLARLQLAMGFSIYPGRTHKIAY